MTKSKGRVYILGKKSLDDRSGASSNKAFQSLAFFSVGQVIERFSSQGLESDFAIHSNEVVVSFCLSLLHPCERLVFHNILHDYVDYMHTA